jgi:hypothetical protein
MREASSSVRLLVEATSTVAGLGSGGCVAFLQLPGMHPPLYFTHMLKAGNKSSFCPLSFCCYDTSRCSRCHAFLWSTKTAEQCLASSISLLTRQRTSNSAGCRPARTALSFLGHRNQQNGLDHTCCSKLPDLANTICIIQQALSVSEALQAKACVLTLQHPTPTAIFMLSRGSDA